MLRINVVISKDNKETVEIGFNPYCQEYEVTICANHDTDLAMFLSDSKGLASRIASSNEEQLEEFKDAGLDPKDFFFDMASNMLSATEIEEMLDDQYLFAFSGSDIQEFIGENIDFLNEHNVLLPTGGRGIALDRKSLDSKLSEYPNIRNPYILLEGNTSGVVVEAARDTIDYIEGITEHVKSLELSPLEEIIYVYDQIRQREYKEELDGESYEKSRGLSDIILGDNIVCAGYSNLYITILKKLGHKIEEFPLDSVGKNKGHSRVIIKVDDDKYDVHGIFESDPTWASKSADDPDYLDNYSFLLRNPDFFRVYDKAIGVSNSLESTRAINDLLRAYRQNYGIVEYTYWIEKYKSLIHTIPKLCGDDPILSVYGDSIIRPTRREFYDRVKGYYDMFSNDSDIPNLMRAISAVREVEHSENPEIKAGKEAMTSIINRYASDDKDFDLTMKAVFGDEGARNNS